MTILERLVSVPRVTEARLARRMNRYPFFAEVQSRAERTIVVDGRRMINVGSNNYLDLAGHPRVVEAAIAATREWGSGVTGSRLLNGTLTLHRALEEDLAAFFGKQDAMILPTGYAANLAVLSTVLDRSDTVLLDRESHASTFDGVLLSGARFRRFRHNDVVHAEVLMGREPDALVLAEGVYSMSGDLAPLGDLVEVCRRLGHPLLVDEAHGVGTAGPTGAGAAEAAGVLDDIDVVTCTFSKSLASCGGAVAADADLIEALRISARPFLFTAASAPATVAAASEALALLREEPRMVTELRSRSKHLASCLDAAEVECRASGSPIITVPCGSDFRTAQVWRMLANRGVFCNPVLSPAVAKGGGLLRLSVMRTHTDEQIEQVAAAFAAIRPLLEASDGSMSLEAPLQPTTTRAGNP